MSIRLAPPQVAGENDRLRVSVTDATPHRRWGVSVAVYQGDTGSVAGLRTRTNHAGTWVFRDSAQNGFQRIKVDAESAAGQVCELELSGRVSRLP